MRLIDYMKEKNLKPYYDTFAEQVGIGRQHLGDVACGIKRPSRALFLRIKDATGGQVTPEELLHYYEEVQAAKLTIPCPNPECPMKAEHP